MFNAIFVFIGTDIRMDLSICILILKLIEFYLENVVANVKMRYYFLNGQRSCKNTKK